MRSAAAAFAWEFQRRLRWGLIAVGAYLAVLALLQLTVPGFPIDPRQQEVAFAFAVLVPLAAAFLFFMAVFSYGLSGDLAARQSLYPARLFTLPLSNAALAGWPMLYGTLTLAVLWMASAVIALRPAGVPAPLLWPALFAAAFLAWLQVFAWTPYGLPGLRVIVAVLWLTTIDAVVWLAMEREARSFLMVAILAPQVPLAYLAAWSAVGRARRGDTPDWRGLFGRLGRLASAPAGGGAPFASPARAQAWLEWRQHGRSLPAWVAVLVPFEALFLFAVRHEPPVLTLVGLALMLLTPPFLAAFVALTVGRSSPDAGSAYGLAPFVATRPLSTGALVACKLRTALASTLAAWLVVLAALPIALTLSGSWPLVIERARGLAGLLGPTRALVFALLCLLALLAATWKQLVQGLCVGLTGREPLVKASVAVRLSWLVVIGLCVQELMVSHTARIAVWNGLRWIPAVLALLKVGAAAWIAARLARGGLLGGRAIAAGAAAWLAAVLALFGALAWLADSPHIPHDVLVLLAVLGVPVVRPSAVLLALARSRHGGWAPTTPPGADGEAFAMRAPSLLLAAPLALAAALNVSFTVRNRDNGGLASSGERRTYRLYVPKSYDSARPAPLVVSLHGGALWGAAQMHISRWNEVAEAEGLIVVYPSGLGGRGPRAWRVGTGPGAAQDVRFIAELIDTLRASYNIDPARIYADGLSNGGGMAFLLSCTLSDRIAAIGAVASAQFLPWSECTDRRPMPVIAFHGTEDRFTPYHGGRSWVAPAHTFPSIPAWMEGWARRNRCRPVPSEARIAGDVSRRAYEGCAEGADVVLYTIHGGGHTWPGSRPEWFVGRTTSSVDASREAWAFFRAHPLARR